VEQRADRGLADHERVIHGSRDPSASGIGISRHAELSKRGSDVEIGPLADHAFIFEFEDDDQRKVDFAAGRRKTPPVPIVCSDEASLDDDRIVCVMHSLGLEPEVREALLVLIQKCVDSGVAVPDLSGSHDLVPRVAESRDAASEVVGVFGLHVLTDRRLPYLPQAQHDGSLSRGAAMALSGSAASATKL